MKRALLGTSALLGVGMMVHPALAEEPIHLTIGGYYKAAYMGISDDNGVLDDDDDANPELGHNTNRDGLFSDAEIHFLGSTVLDNGLEVGVQIELEGEDQFDQIDEAYVWFGGGFGELRVGSDDEALHKACVIPPGGSSNFSAFSPNQWAANTGGLMSAFAGFGDNSICTGVDGTTDAQKIIYTSPVFAGFQLTASYTPNGGDETHDDGVGTHVGMPTNTPGESRHNTSVALNYGYEGNGWGLAASLGGSWEGHKEEDNESFGGADVSFGEQEFYQAGINVFIGNFAIGVGGEIYNDLVDFRFEGDSITNDVWVAGVGMSYAYDAWIFGVQYSHREDEFVVSADEEDELDLSQDRVIGTTTYLLGPGMNLDASIAYTWLDADPEAVLLFDDSGGLDDYQAIEVGVGATLTF
jgi:outer membrane protein OmpU